MLSSWKSPSRGDGGQEGGGGWAGRGGGCVRHDRAYAREVRARLPPEYFKGSGRVVQGGAGGSLEGRDLGGLRGAG